MLNRRTAEALGIGPQWIERDELAKAAEDYELSTRAINEEGDTAKIETVADEQVI